MPSLQSLSASQTFSGSSGESLFKPLWQRIWAHYPLFRVAEEMNPVAATFWTLMNVFGNGVKKMFHVKKYKIK